MAHTAMNRRALLQWLRSCAETGACSPTDEEIQDRFAFAGVESARTLLAELADAGEITIVRKNGERSGIRLGRTPAAPAARIGRIEPAIKGPAEPEEASRLDLIRQTAERLQARGRTGTQARSPLPPPAQDAVLAEIIPTKAPEPAPARERAVARPAMLLKGSKRQVTFSVEPATYDQLSVEAARHRMAVGRVVSDHFHRSFSASGCKPLAGMDVVHAALAAGQPLHTFVADMVRLGLAEHQRRASPDSAAS
jgi:hypothetical protein